MFTFQKGTVTVILPSKMGNIISYLFRQLSLHASVFSTTRGDALPQNSDAEPFVGLNQASSTSDLSLPYSVRPKNHHTMTRKRARGGSGLVRAHRSVGADPGHTHAAGRYTPSTYICRSCGFSGLTAHNRHNSYTPTRLCWSCGIQGHTAPNCRNSNTRTPRTNICWCCGNTGHTIRTCAKYDPKNPNLPYKP